jgi:hypothetical protein
LCNSHDDQQKQPVTVPLLDETAEKPGDPEIRTSEILR